MTGAVARRVSLRVVLVVAFVLVATLGIGSVTVTRYVWLTRDFLQEQLQEDVTLARAVVAGLERYMRARIHLIDTLAADLATQDLADRATLLQELDRVNRRDLAFTGLLVADLEGEPLALALPPEQQGRSLAGLRYGDRAWFRQALRTPTQPSYDIILARAQGRPTVTVASPIRTRAGGVIGVLAGSVDLDDLRASLRVVDSAGADRIVVVDSQGHVIVHSSRAWEAEARDLSAERVFQAAQRQPEGTVEYQSLFTGTRRWAAYVRMASTGWVVSASRGPEFVGARVQRLVRDSVLLGLLGILVAAVAAVLVSGVLTRTLRTLAEATRQVAAGRFEDGGLMRGPGSPIREFDELQHGFRDMAAALQSQYHTLEAQVAERTQALAEREREARATAALLRVQEAIQRGYGELAALLNSLDRSHILAEATKKIAASLHAPLAAVYLTENSAAGLRLKTYTAVDAAALDTTLLAPTGLPAEVARRGAPVVLSRSDDTEPLRLQTGVGTVDVTAVAGWPLIFQSRFVGVLVVALLEPMTAHVQGFLDNATRQLSVALNNAALFESIRYQAQETERLNAELRRASEVKSQFLASMSHELRTPLNSIIGFTELLLASQREPLSERQRTALEKVREGGQHLLALINDVLDLSKIEAGRVDIRPTRFALAPLVHECLAGVEPQAQAKGLRVGAMGLDGAPEVVQDRARLKQILLNLLSNAVKFTATGSVEVRVEPDGDGVVAIAVADTGIGIRPEDLDAIFDQFQQVDAPEVHAAGGTGLGLAISRRLAQLMGGTLTVESTPGRGSVFTLRLPVRHAPVPSPAETAVAPDPTAGVPAGAPRMLVIDDSRDAMELIREAVTGEPIRVEWAASPAAGLARVRARRPAVILLDVMLQGEEDGWDVLDALKRDPATRDIPVVVHSVIDNPRRAEQLGADGVLVKPAEADALRVLVRRILAGRHGGPREDESAPT